jgi:hypothetical protein
MARPVLRRMLIGYVVEMGNLVKGKKYAYLGRGRRGRGVRFIHIGESARGIRTRHTPEYRIARIGEKKPFASPPSLRISYARARCSA